MGNLERFEATAETFRNQFRPFCIGFRQQSNKFLSAITRHHIGGTKSGLGCQGRSNQSQALIACSVPVVVVEYLEMIDIY